ncbi:hypothetical protein KGM_211370 [Danaus plexippus plexippus]|uniref:Uncharacterized protein n=1 Tax=Danaus plexippus plexippus TaxID=278856 RepID=A0A212F731_DANPL|nr:hypothetical protein KGM_211370 [Danaus plexippus plexippus]
MLARHVIGQDNGIFGAIIRGVDDGINMFRNSLDVGIRSFINDEPTENSDLSALNGDESQFNQNQDSYEWEEPYSSTSGHRYEEDYNSQENHKQQDRGLTHKKDPINHTHLPVHKRKPQNIRANKQAVPNKHTLQGNGYISNATLVKKVDFLSVEKTNGSLTKNKDYTNANITTMLNDILNKTSKPLIIVMNGTVIENTVPNVSVVSNSTINLNSTQTALNVTVKNDNGKHIMKSITKTKFFFQVRPLRPMNEIKSENETVYYIEK